MADRLVRDDNRVLVSNDQTTDCCTVGVPEATSSCCSMKGPNTQPPSRPNLSTYWVTDHFLAGAYPGGDSEEDTRGRMKKFLEAGITLFVDLTEAEEEDGYDSILLEEAAKQNVQANHKRCSIPDFETPNHEQMKGILDTIDSVGSSTSSPSNDKVYVHCWGGIGRTGTVVGCYLRRHGNTGPEAVSETNRLFQSTGRGLGGLTSPDTPEQRQFIMNWNES